mmetsp:Transcript_19303/g.27929  ORF Transcript_19303/g.27929 Transcript_19303/m.27929 type:complete len:93 (+) Transcript_19303:445-723(+)
MKNPVGVTGLLSILSFYLPATVIFGRDFPIIGCVKVETVDDDSPTTTTFYLSGSGAVKAEDDLACVEHGLKAIGFVADQDGTWRKEAKETSS